MHVSAGNPPNGLGLECGTFSTLDWTTDIHIKKGRGKRRRRKNTPTYEEKLREREGRDKEGRGKDFAGFLYLYAPVR